MKKRENQPESPAQAVLDRDAELQAAAESFVEGDRSDEALRLLRDRAVAFADAWRACEPAGKGRP